MTSQAGQQIHIHNAITIYTFPNISRGKSNQAMKFSQLIEYNMRNIFQDPFIKD